MPEKKQPDLTPTGGTCPLCAKPALTAYRPFCSSHCANLDLSRWLNGVYAVPARGEDEEDEDVSEADPSLH
jgi:endogenous inhibitor of DNA gyrase (YacG/DUF329 family)